MPDPNWRSGSRTARTPWRNSPGFLGFQLLRPVKGEGRYFVVTQWESDEAFQAWASGPAREAHAGERAKPVATGASLLEFEVVLDVAAKPNPDPPHPVRRRTEPVTDKSVTVSIIRLTP